MRAVRTRAWKRFVREANRAQWDLYLTNVALWPFRARLRFAWLILRPPKRHRQSAAERKVIAARKKRRAKRAQV